MNFHVVKHKAAIEMSDKWQVTSFYNDMCVALLFCIGKLVKGKYWIMIEAVADI